MSTDMLTDRQKSNELLIHNNMEKIQINYAEWKKPYVPQTPKKKEYDLYDLIHIIF